MALELEKINWAWIELTKDSHGHGGQGWDFGSCLWSPSKDRLGKDRYATMRLVQPGDFVLHFLRKAWEGKSTESRRLCGVSQVAKSHRVIDKEPPSPGDWAGMGEYLRIELKNYTPLAIALPIKLLTTVYEEEITIEIDEDAPKFFPFSRYGKGIHTVQGSYLTRATPRLMGVIKNALSVKDHAMKVGSDQEGLHYEFVEGARKKRETHFFARNPQLVAAAKREYGYNCQVCGFNFEEIYGELGKEFIECHHLNPLAERSAQNRNAQIVTSIKDVAVLCTNCHRMIHRMRPALGLDYLRKLLSRPA